MLTNQGPHEKKNVTKGCHIYLFLLLFILFICFCSGTHVCLHLWLINACVTFTLPLSRWNFLTKRQETNLFSDLFSHKIVIRILITGQINFGLHILHKDAKVPLVVLERKQLKKYFKTTFSEFKCFSMCFLQLNSWICFLWVIKS